jgi:hypothetical protein
VAVEAAAGLVEVLRLAAMVVLAAVVVKEHLALAKLEALEILLP